MATILTIFLRINLPNSVQAYRYDTSPKRSDGMIFTRPRKGRYMYGTQSRWRHLYRASRTSRHGARIQLAAGRPRETPRQQTRRATAFLSCVNVAPCPDIPALERRYRRMGGRLRAGTPSRRYVTSQLRVNAAFHPSAVAESSTSFAWGKGGSA